MQLLKWIGRAFGRPEEGGFIWGHWSNDADSGFPFGGRAWVHIGEGLTLSTSWDLRGRSSHACLGTDELESEVTAGLALGPSLWFGVQSSKLRGLIKRLGGERELRLAAHDGAVWWSVWTDPNEWKSTTPRWRHGNFDVVDFVLGKAVYESAPVGPAVNVVVPMPERGYKGTCQLEVASWKRPRWFTKTVKRAQVDMANDPVPFPGKGENSWDCGQDATYAISTPAASVAEAVAAVTASVLRSRERYASLDWIPEARPEAAA